MKTIRKTIRFELDGQSFSHPVSSDGETWHLKGEANWDIWNETGKNCWDVTERIEAETGWWIGLDLRFTFHHRPTQDEMVTLRNQLQKAFPDAEIIFPVTAQERCHRTGIMNDPDLPGLIEYKYKY